MSSLEYSGHLYFRHRLVLSILSGKPIKIDKIRPGDKNPGLCGAPSQAQSRRVLMLRKCEQIMKSAYCD
jgi:RNA 3'-terminal phosphate cyclase